MRAGISSHQQQIKLAEEQVKTVQVSLQLAMQRYKLGLGTVVEVTQSEIAVMAAHQAGGSPIRLQDCRGDASYSAGGRSQMEIDSASR